MIENNTAENRAWFFTYDPKISGKMYVMYDQENNSINYVMDLKMAKTIDLNNIKPLIFNVEDNKRAKLDYILKWDFLANSTGNILANEKALKVLEEIAKDDIQAIPTEIRMPNGTVINNYYLINIITGLNSNEILDKEKSILLPEEKRKVWQTYEKLYYSVDCLKEHNFAVIIDEILSLTSNKVKKAVEEAGLKGLVFKDIWGGVAFIE